MARQRGKRVKVVGGGHSPSDIACTDDFMIQMGKMNRILKVRPAFGWVILSRGGTLSGWPPRAGHCTGAAIPGAGDERGVFLN